VTSLADLCLDLFLLGHAHLAAGQAGDGVAFERRVRDHLDTVALSHGTGFRIFPRRSTSGIYHQLDEEITCAQACVVGEWKAYTGQIPKNDLIRFKSATDDYWLAHTTRRDQPVVRIFGGTGSVTEAMRAYAAQWGIIRIVPDRWPIPTLCDPELLSSPGRLDPPSQLDRRALTSLARPLNTVLELQQDRSWRIPAVPTPADLDGRLQLWEQWSDRAWGWWDDDVPARFDWLVDSRIATGLAA
jgi:hypothetical protein